MKTKKILRQDEMALVKKLCKLEPFEPNPAEQILLKAFLASGITKKYKDRSIEVTNLGADCYIATLDN